MWIVLILTNAIASLNISIASMPYLAYLYEDNSFTRKFLSWSQLFLGIYVLVMLVPIVYLIDTVVKVMLL